jgi:hypothetical protein
MAAALLGGLLVGALAVWWLSGHRVTDQFSADFQHVKWKVKRPEWLEPEED